MWRFHRYLLRKHAFSIYIYKYNTFNSGVDTGKVGGKDPLKRIRSVTSSLEQTIGVSIIFSTLSRAKFRPASATGLVTMYLCNWLIKIFY